jgi:hypothetical protein
VRFALAVFLPLVLAACPADPLPQTQYCNVDSDCGGEVCARDGECAAASDIRGVKVTWTINGQAASMTTCAPAPDFYLEFYDTSYCYDFCYAPVPCMQGQFFIDKIPLRYTEVALSSDQSNFAVTKLIDATNTASFDLNP